VFYEGIDENADLGGVAAMARVERVNSKNIAFSL
jgi:hypothetical protein